MGAVRLSFVAVFAGVLAWFAAIDVYHKHFFNPGPVYVGYTLARVLFLAYLAWMQFYIGRRLLRFCQRRGAQFTLQALDEFIVCFYTGGAVLAGYIFALGFLNLYYYWLFAAASVALVGLSAAEAGPAFAGWSTAVRRLRPRRFDMRTWAAILIVSCTVLMALLLLAVKGLYPGGGHDYYTHYCPYYRRVLALHGLWPNDVWYHFYYSKGATIVISSMLLTDMQAPETVTYLYVLVATLCVYSLLRRCARDRIVPCLGMAACLAAFLWTDQPFEWGHFQKQHEQTASLLISVVWLACISPNALGTSLRAWMTMAALCAGHCILHTPVMFPLLCVALGMTLATACLRRTWGVLWTVAAGLGGATVVLASVLSINYLCTGMLEITPLRLYWPYADQERLSRWVSPYLMVLLLEGADPNMGKIGLTEMDERWQFIFHLMRAVDIRLFFPGLAWLLPLALLLVFGATTIRLTIRQTLPTILYRWYAAIPIVGTFASALVLGQLASQPSSVFTSFSFMAILGVLLVLGLYCVSVRCLNLRGNKLQFAWVLLPALAGCIGTYRAIQGLPDTSPAHLDGAKVRTEISRVRLAGGVEFALGLNSLDEAYQARGVDSYVPRKIREEIGYGPRVYTVNFFRYSMAPGCELESMMSFALQQDYHTILFEPPELARAALQQQGLNYFLFELRPEGDDIDILHYAPLFRPENLRKNFELRWQFGYAYLLTWPGPGTRPLPDDFMRQYTARYGERKFRPLYELMRQIYEDSERKLYPIRRDPSLPPAKGWQ